MIADASPIALGGVLVQFNEQRTARVVCYASKSLSETENRYCQMEKEALALVESVEKFHIYLHGKTFELVIDHKPLEAILNPLHLQVHVPGSNGGCCVYNHTVSL